MPLKEIRSIRSMMDETTKRALINAVKSNFAVFKATSAFTALSEELAARLARHDSRLQRLLDAGKFDSAFCRSLLLQETLLEAQEATA